jgi:hypothetical protein
MIAVQGYYDGNGVQTLEKIHAEKNQRIIITILDEFIDEKPVIQHKDTVRGSLSQYANPALQEQEKNAWEKAVVDKYGNA